MVFSVFTTDLSKFLNQKEIEIVARTLVVVGVNLFSFSTGT
jgi:hypothetical protein